MSPQSQLHSPLSSTTGYVDEDDIQLAAQGYTPSFKREFSNLATISFAFSIMGLCSSVATTFNTPLLFGGPSSVVWCWILGKVSGNSFCRYGLTEHLWPGATMCFTLGTSIAELVSAYPTSGQVAGVSSTEFGLSNMIWAAVAIARPGLEITSGKVVGLFAGLLMVHGILNSLATRHLAWMTKGFVFVNLGATILIIIVLLACTKRSDMHPAGYVFGSSLINQTGGWNNGLAFLFGLLSVQWTFSHKIYTDDGSFSSVSSTKRCIEPPMLIMQLRMGTAGALVLWTPVCFTAFAVAQTVCPTRKFAYCLCIFQRPWIPGYSDYIRRNNLFVDDLYVDRGLFGRINQHTRTPLYSVWVVVLLAFLPGLLDLASPIASNAVFSLTAIALDSSYIIPGWVAGMDNEHNVLLMGLNMNYASVITAGVVVFSLIWYFLGGRKHYKGPVSNLPKELKDRETPRNSDAIEDLEKEKSNRYDL
ncbi:hypothetical protein Clacol_003539 [Clathrus columnatus]|uniref:Uncharacterized protein n=1 Tax=Clathrus columnatus TaxID=1419009 RepID=A0AAV5A3Z7_9AGAM|nr:hypothetical protein Clacol_003539 [Clathrus columnatus]